MAMVSDTFCLGLDVLITSCTLEMQPLIDYDIIFGALYAAIVVIEVRGHMDVA